MRDRLLPWYRLDRRPDGTHCDRHECENIATLRVTWPRHSGGYAACRYHAGWWIQHTGVVDVSPLVAR